MTSFAINLKKRGLRYDREAEEAIQYPRRFVLFGPRILTIRRFLEIEAQTQHVTQKRENRERGRRVCVEQALERRERLARKTQGYIEGIKDRLDKAADEGITVGEFIRRERAAVMVSRDGGRGA